MHAKLKELQAKRQGGFTLVELIIVIAIIGILAAIVIFGVANFTESADTAACEAEVATINTAAAAYNAQLGAYPTVTQLETADYLEGSPSKIPGATQTPVTDANCTL